MTFLAGSTSAAVDLIEPDQVRSTDYYYRYEYSMYK